MKIFFCLLLFPVMAFAQPILPSYPVVVKTFYAQYSFAPSEAGLNFAKKKDGWHVLLVNRINEEVQDDQLYWSPANGFQTLRGYDSADPGSAEAQVDQYLSGNADYQPHGYERCAYYGYSNWAEDMIRDFHQSRREGKILSDTLLEGMGRAYSAYSSKFLWYQFGGAVDSTDPLKIKLQGLEPPSTRRLDSVQHYLDLGIACFDDLAKIKPGYRTLVGNAAMKAFGEKMNAFIQMSMAGDNKRAARYIGMIKPEENLVQMGKNYLAACSPNAILFTFGDMDTYPLWYVQQSSGFRKDVSVINANLLAMPMYLKYLYSHHIVNFSTPLDTAAKNNFVYMLQMEGSSQSASAPLPQFIKEIQTKRYPAPVEPYGTLAGYPYKELTLDIDLPRFSKLSTSAGLSTTARLPLGPFLYSSDFMILDILNSNLHTRPIFLTNAAAGFAGSLQRAGIIYQWIPLDPAKKKAIEEEGERATANYFTTIYRPTPSNSSNGPAPASQADGAAYDMFATATRYYLKHKQEDSARLLLDRLNEAYGRKLPMTMNFPELGTIHLDLGMRETGMAMLENFGRFLYRLYTVPSTNFPYQSRENVLLLLNGIKSTLHDRNLQSSEINQLIERVERR